MIQSLILAGLLCAPIMATAQELPALYNVTDVANDDVLNIRAAPSAQSQIIGSYAPHSTGIEVIARSDNGRWGMVNINDGTGWASLRFLSEQPGQTLPPVAYACFGTEPFWSFDVSSPNVTWSDFNVESANLLVDWTGTGMRPDRFAVRALGDLTLLSASVRRETCSDGMSDRTYGFSVDAIVDQPGELQPIFVSGCCTLSP